MTEFTVEFTESIILEMHLNKKYGKFIDKSVNKFILANWGKISKKDSLINNLVISNEIFDVPVIGIYDSKKYGAIMIYDDLNNGIVRVQPLDKSDSYIIRRNFSSVII